VKRALANYIKQAIQGLFTAGTSDPKTTGRSNGAEKEKVGGERGLKPMVRYTSRRLSQ
jgi:hypothetical protein